MRPRPRGGCLGEANARRGSTGSNRVTPACFERTPWMRKPSKSDWERVRPGRRELPVIETTRRAGCIERCTRYPGGKDSESGNPRVLPA